VYGFVFLRWKKSISKKSWEFFEPNQKFTKEIAIWRRTADKIHETLEEEKAVKQKLMDYIVQLENKKMKSDKNKQPRTSPLSIKELEEQHPIADYDLCLKSAVIMITVVLLFILHSLIDLNLTLAWISIIGAMMLLLVSGIHEINEVLEKIELTTLVFFAGMFILMRSEQELRLFDWIEDRMMDIIEEAPAGKSREVVAVLLVMWVSALTVSLVGNIPFTSTMITMIIKLKQHKELELDHFLMPLVWALSFGVCFGGNGSLLGSSVNIVACGLSEAEGFPVSWRTFFVYSFPCTLISLTVASVYVIVVNVLLGWY